VGLYEVIRRDARRDGLGVRALAKRHGVHRRTVRQALASPIPPPRKARGSVAESAKALVVARCCARTSRRPRKQRHTARRVLARLIDEHGLGELSYSSVRDYVATHRAFASQGQEFFLEGHAHAYTELGGVPTDRIHYDNLKSAVQRVLFGCNRTESDRWITFRSWAGFDAFYCRRGVEGAHEKGVVRTRVVRRLKLYRPTGERDMVAAAAQGVAPFRPVLHFGMPTTRPRHFVTETDDLAVALDAAARRWPDLSRPQLLVRLALEGDHAAQQAQQERRQRRLAAVRQHSGILTGAYGPDYLHKLREDWPA
jgi:DNA-binding transcriptional regulator YhcF (GntR family)